MKKLFCILLLFAIPAWAELTIDATEERPNGKTIVYFTVTDGENTYKWHGVDPLPSEEKLLELIQGKIAANGEWVDTHPNVYPFANAAEKATAVASAQDLADSLSFADVDTYVENQFADHTAAQKAFLKKVGKAVLYLLKKE